MVALFRCVPCDRYTLQAICAACSKGTARTGPPKYSPEDPYGAYRRKLKRLTAGPPKAP